MRPSIDMERMAEPMYSITWPAPPLVPMMAMRCRARSLAPTPGRNSPSTRTRHILHLPRAQRLRRQHVLDFGRADAVGQGAEGAVRGGVAVAADDGEARLRAALLGADHVDDAVADVAHREELDAVLGITLRASVSSCSRASGSLTAGHAEGLALGGRVVVGDGERQVRPAHLAAIGLEAREGLRGRHLVDEVEVDIEKALARRPVRVDDVGCPRSCRRGCGAMNSCPAICAGGRAVLQAVRARRAWATKHGRQDSYASSL